LSKQLKVGNNTVKRERDMEEKPKMSINASEALDLTNSCEARIQETLDMISAQVKMACDRGETELQIHLDSLTESLRQSVMGAVEEAGFHFSATTTPVCKIYWHPY
jgi:hypothetical protein